MKKLLSVLLLILLVSSAALADVPDFSDLTFDQLVALQHYVTMEVMKRPEWKEVTVPSGQWIVGVDIPAGTYSIKPTGGGGYLRIYDNKGHLGTSGGIRNDEDIIGKVYLKDNYMVEIEDGSLIFAPALSLGF